jgi:hypothetical protein
VASRRCSIDAQHLRHADEVEVQGKRRKLARIGSISSLRD